MTNQYKASIFPNSFVRKCFFQGSDWIEEYFKDMICSLLWLTKIFHAESKFHNLNKILSSSFVSEAGRNRRQWKWILQCIVSCEPTYSHGWPCVVRWQSCPAGSDWVTGGKYSDGGDEISSFLGSRVASGPSSFHVPAFGSLSTERVQLYTPLLSSAHSQMGYRTNHPSKWKWLSLLEHM